MVSSKATTVTAYLASLEPERRQGIAAMRKLIRAHLPKGHVESMNRGMIAYELPLAVIGKLVALMPVEAFIARHEAVHKKPRARK